MKTFRAPHVAAVVVVALATTAFVACEKKDDATAEKPATPAASAPAKASAEPIAEAKPDAATNAATNTTATSAAASAASAEPKTPAVASASAKPAASASAKAAASAAPADPLQPSRTRVDGKNFALDVASPGCRVDADCTLTIRLSANGEYHVNKEYPYKFLAQAAPQITFLGKDDPNTFSRASGDFREDGEKAATLTVRFRPKSAGDAKIAGTYKMSVCSAENCQIEAPKLELTVAVK